MSRVNRIIDDEYVTDEKIEGLIDDISYLLIPPDFNKPRLWLQTYGKMYGAIKGFLNFLNYGDKAKLNFIDELQRRYDKLKSVAENIIIRYPRQTIFSVLLEILNKVKDVDDHIISGPGYMECEDQTQHCNICMEDNHAHDNTFGNYMIATDCNHTFHVGCIRHWLTVSKTCPCCRQEFTSVN